MCYHKESLHALWEESAFWWAYENNSRGVSQWEIVGKTPGTLIIFNIFQILSELKKKISKVFNITLWKKQLSNYLSLSVSTGGNQRCDFWGSKCKWANSLFSLLLS